MNNDKPNSRKAKKLRNKKIFKMIDEGYSYNQVASEFDLTAQGVAYLVKTRKENNNE